MGESLEIVIWDYNPDRIAAIDRNLHSALKKLGRHGNVTSMSEPPLLARTGMLDRAPVLEIEGKYWSLVPGMEIPETACEQLILQLTAEP